VPGTHKNYERNLVFAGTQPSSLKLTFKKMENYNKILEKFIHNFVYKRKQERILYLASKPKRREDLLWELFHDPRYFDSKYISDCSGYDDDEILNKLKEMKFGNDAFVFVGTWFPDGGKLSIEKAFQTKHEWGEDFIICSQTSKLAYYEGHEGWKYILKK